MSDASLFRPLLRRRVVLKAIAIWTPTLVAGIYCWLNPASVWFATLLVLALSAATATTAPANASVATLTAYLERRKLFYPADLDREIVRINLLRIVAGLLLCHRTAYTLQYLIYTDYNASQLTICVLLLVGGVMLTVGLLTPLVAFCLLLSYRQLGDFEMSTYTLSTDIMQMMLMILAFAPAGTKLSVDSRLPPVLYNLIGSPTRDRVAIVRFCAMLSYGILCLFSVIRHASDDGWMQGYVIAHALTAAATSKNFETIRELQTAAPALFYYVTKALTYLMSSWELLFIPFVLWGRPTRGIAVVWGLLFFLASAALLVVQWLPSFQFTLFALIFWSSFGINVNGSRALNVYYDDRCNLCDRTVRTLQAIDLFTVLQFRPLSVHTDELQRHAISPQQALTDLIGIDPNSQRVFSGYEFYIEISKRLLLMMPLAPFLWLGKAVLLGPAVYRTLADRRTRLFGVCTKAVVVNEPSRPQSIRSRPFVIVAFAVSYSILLVVAPLQTPLSREHIQARFVPTGLVNATPFYGLMSISVFNQDWLPLAENFFTIEAVWEGDKASLLPFIGRDGQYLAWPNWSDRAFIGDALYWRMGLVRSRVGCYDRQRDHKVLANLLSYSKRFFANPAYYRVTYYHEPIIPGEEWRLLKPIKYRAEQICAVKIDPNSAEKL